MELDDINRRNEAGSEQDNSTGSRKKGAVRKLDEEYGIDYNILHQYSDKKLKDVAHMLGGQPQNSFFLNEIYCSLSPSSYILHKNVPNT